MWKKKRARNEKRFNEKKHRNQPKASAGAPTSSKERKFFNREHGKASSAGKMIAAGALAGAMWKRPINTALHAKTMTEAVLLGTTVFLQLRRPTMIPNLIARATFGTNLFGAKPMARSPTPVSFLRNLYVASLCAGCALTLGTSFYCWRLINLKPSDEEVQRR